MRDYQPKIKNPYKLPGEIYKCVLYAIRAYSSLKEEYKNRLSENYAPDYNANTSGKKSFSDPTYKKAVQLEKLHDDLKAIDEAVKKIEKDPNGVYYMPGIWNNIVKGAPYPHDADTGTYSKWKARFIYEVARNKGYI